jgi:hypothetical protein
MFGKLLKLLPVLEIFKPFNKSKGKKASLLTRLPKPAKSLFEKGRKLSQLMKKRKSKD